MSRCPGPLPRCTPKLAFRGMQSIFFTFPQVCNSFGKTRLILRPRPTHHSIKRSFFSCWFGLPGPGSLRPKREKKSRQYINCLANSYGENKTCLQIELHPKISMLKYYVRNRNAVEARKTPFPLRANRSPIVIFSLSSPYVQQDVPGV